MTERKDSRQKRLLPLRERTPVFVSREAGAAELCISVSSWNDLVRAGKLPPPTVWLGKSGTTPRWLWSDVMTWLTGRIFTSAIPAPEALSAQPKDSEPFFRELPDEKTRPPKKRDRQSAARRSMRPETERADVFLLPAGTRDEERS